MDWKQHIVVDPTICHGRPCFAGTRVLVSAILDELVEGTSVADIVASYPALKSESVSAAFAYAADLARERIVELRAG